MLQPTASTTPQTRQKTATMTARKPDNTDGINTDMHTKEEAIGFLTTKEYLLQGKPADLLTLLHILLQLGTTAIKMPKVLTDGIRVITSLMADAAVQHMANEITAMVKDQLQEHLETFVANVEMMRDAVEHITGAAKEITAQVTQELTERNADVTKATTTTPNFTYQPLTYANVIQQHVPPAHESVVARG